MPTGWTVGIGFIRRKRAASGLAAIQKYQFLSSVRVVRWA
jgi:hypothetical protein